MFKPHSPWRFCFGGPSRLTRLDTVPCSGLQWASPCVLTNAYARVNPSPIRVENACTTREAPLGLFPRESYLYLLPLRGNHRSDFYHRTLSFASNDSRKPYNRYSFFLFWMFWLDVVFLYAFVSFHVLVVANIAECILSYKYIAVYAYTILLMNVEISFFSLMNDQLLWPFFHKSYCNKCFLFLLGIYAREGYFNPWIVVYLTLWEAIIRCLWSGCGVMLHSQKQCKSSGPSHCAAVSALPAHLPGVLLWVRFACLWWLMMVSTLEKNLNVVMDPYMPPFYLFFSCRNSLFFRYLCKWSYPPTCDLPLHFLGRTPWWIEEFSIKLNFLFFIISWVCPQKNSFCATRSQRCSFYIFF